MPETSPDEHPRRLRTTPKFVWLAGHIVEGGYFPTVIEGGHVTGSCLTFVAG